MKFDSISTVKPKLGGGSYVIVGKCAQKETQQNEHKEI